MPFTGHEDHLISLADAAVLTKHYRDQFSGTFTKAEFFGKDAIESLLNQGDSVGIRIYYGLDANNVPRLVIVGAETNEDDILVNNLIMERGILCPPSCGVNNSLNS